MSWRSSSTRPAATFVEVRSIGGLNDTVNCCLAAKLSDMLQRAVGTPPERVYLNFTDVAAYNWGWNGKTFG
jgi:phenylpyruvate tautomerase PptA (4-oxalocrotonate tautomerase family)